MISQAILIYLELKQSSGTANHQKEPTSRNLSALDLAYECAFQERKKSWRTNRMRSNIMINHTPFLPMYSAIWPLAIAPTIAPTFDNEPNIENCNHENERSIETKPKPKPTQCWEMKKTETNPHLRKGKSKITDDIWLRRRRISALSATNKSPLIHCIQSLMRIGPISEKETETVQITVKPNWIGPKATMRTHKKMETELSRRIWAEEDMALDCREPIRYQLPVWRNGFRRSRPSSSSLKLMAACYQFRPMITPSETWEKDGIGYRRRWRRAYEWPAKNKNI